MIFYATVCLCIGSLFAVDLVIYVVYKEKFWNKIDEARVQMLHSLKEARSKLYVGHSISNERKQNNES